MAERTWTCQRVSNKVKCGATNPKRLQICAVCGKRRPPTKKPAHKAVLDLVTYEQCVEIFGDRCMICGAEAKKNKLSRDHDHSSGILRGILCYQCNTALPKRVTLEWMQRATSYLLAAAERECDDNGLPILLEGLGTERGEVDLLGAVVDREHPAGDGDDDCLAGRADLEDLTDVPEVLLDGARRDPEFSTDVDGVEPSAA